jgi:hypothetical protein
MPVIHTIRVNEGENVKVVVVQEGLSDVVATFVALYQLLGDIFDGA